MHSRSIVVEPEIGLKRSLKKPDADEAQRLAEYGIEPGGATAEPW
jgi:hypothetical protein